MKAYLLLFCLLGALPAHTNLPNAKHNHLNGGIKPGASGSFTATVGGKPYSGKNNHATLSVNYANMGINVFTVESFASNDALAARTDAHFVFLIHFTGSAPQLGAYQLQDANLRKPFTSNTGKYDRGWKTGDSGSPTETTYSFAPAKGGSGSLTITALNANVVSGTFSGIAVNSKKEKIMITNGVFSNLAIH